ncbi:MAG: hypothetical protein R3B09_33035 [Nannocystaceae bacterium]
MITTQIVAHVRRVLRGHSDRALVHAVDGAGIEYKIEVPLDQVRALDEAQGYALALTYAIHSVPGLPPLSAGAGNGASPAPSSTQATTPAPTTSGTIAGTTTASDDAASVDAQFMALMNRRSSPVGAALTPSSSSTAAEPSAAGSAMPTAGPSIDAVVDQIFGPR